MTAALLALLALDGCAPRKDAPPGATPVNPNLRIALATRPPVPRQLDPTQFTIMVKDAHGRPISGATVTADLTMPGMDMGENKVALTPQAPGTYAGAGRFTMAGSWRVTVTAVRANDRSAQSFPITVQ
ncbi:MAG: FixH family protein [Armatimonadetes bacterium]|nr:FixH family protein [Armatimonadota bacterium]